MERDAVEAEQAQVEVVHNEAQNDDVQPKVELNTDEISKCHAFTPADEMEAEERELVIEDSVDNVRTYAQQPLSDAEIREQALTDPRADPPASERRQPLLKQPAAGKNMSRKGNRHGAMKHPLSLPFQVLLRKTYV